MTIACKIDSAAAALNAILIAEQSVRRYDRQSQELADGLRNVANALTAAAEQVVQIEGVAFRASARARVSVVSPDGDAA
jgi:hypothetical protein